MFLNSNLKLTFKNWKNYKVKRVVHNFHCEKIFSEEIICTLFTSYGVGVNDLPKVYLIRK